MIQKKTKRPHLLNESTWLDIKNMNIELAVLPWGATEPHNYHLPYGTDTLETEAIADRAGRLTRKQGGNVMILPAIPFGVNTGQIDLKMTINLNPGTQFEILKDILQSLSMQGIEKFCILNGHGGNDFKQMIRELNLLFPKMFIFQVNWFKIANDNIFENPGDHADEMETSLMMHLAADVIRPLSEAGEGRTKSFRMQAFHEGWAWAPRAWSQISKDTGSGDPSLATPEKGARYFESITTHISDLFCEIIETKIDNLYE